MAFNKLLVLCVILSCVFYAQGLKCVQCENCDNSEESKDCTDTTATFCFMTTSDADSSDNWKRGCTTAADYCKGSERVVKSACSVCDEDDCNSAASLSSSLFLGAVAALVLKFYY